MTTQTASLAQPLVPVKAQTGLNMVTGQHVGVLSTSASGFILLCKVPAPSTVILMEHHVSAETTYTLNFGVRSGASTSYAASAFLGTALLNANNQSLPITLEVSAAEESLNERFKYITASVQAGSRTTSVSIYYTVLYNV